MLEPIDHASNNILFTERMMKIIVSIIDEIAKDSRQAYIEQSQDVSLN
tara:strand:- start:367 stop:510 length:144 start_codon:yes stop_codon:yes gene_type:complete